MSPPDTLIRLLPPACTGTPMVKSAWLGIGSDSPLIEYYNQVSRPRSSFASSPHWNWRSSTRSLRFISATRCNRSFVAYYQAEIVACRRRTPLRRAWRVEEAAARPSDDHDRRRSSLTRGVAISSRRASTRSDSLGGWAALGRRSRGLRDLRTRKTVLDSPEHLCYRACPWVPRPGETPQDKDAPGHASDREPCAPPANDRHRPGRLKPNRFSLSIYGDPSAEIDDLLPSIRDHGILVALVVAPGPGPGTWEVISGHRRLACALALNFAQVPCEVRPLPPGPERRRAVLEYNRQRRKSFSQLMREADALEELWAAEANSRRLANLQKANTEPIRADCRNSDDRE